MTPARSEEIIQVERLECRYGGHVVLREVSFSVRRNEIFFVAGRSGCGKSTLLRHLVGLQMPAGGAIKYFGKPFPGAESFDRREFFEAFGVLFQDHALWSDMSLFENISLPLVLYTRLPRATRAEIVALKLAQVGLAGCQDRYPGELSGGMQKRAALARALALDPQILFFDEPTAGLDPITARQINQLILRIRQTVGATVVVVSHRLPSIFSIADRMILLDADIKGIVAMGPPDEIARQTEPPLAREFFHADSIHRTTESGA